MTINKHLMDTSARQFLAIASVQSESFAVKHIFKRISLSAKNAKAIAARAGSQTLGFHPITDFIDDVRRFLGWFEVLDVGVVTQA